MRAGPRRQPRKNAVLERNRKQFERELRDLHESSSVKGRTKRYEKVLERVGRIRERHQGRLAAYVVSDVQEGREDPFERASHPRAARQLPVAPSRLVVRRRLRRSWRERPTPGHSPTRSRTRPRPGRVQDELGAGDKSARRQTSGARVGVGSGSTSGATLRAL